MTKEMKSKLQKQVDYWHKVCQMYQLALLIHKFGKTCACKMMYPRLGDKKQGFSKFQTYNLELIKMVETDDSDWELLPREECVRNLKIASDEVRHYKKMLKDERPS